VRKIFHSSRSCRPIRPFADRRKKEQVILLKGCTAFAPTDEEEMSSEPAKFRQLIQESAS
jgi:hypothetical protein